MSIIVNNITKTYDKQNALDNISFEINTGDIVGFLGPNGAGKSTMMKIISGFIPQTSGEVKVNGFDVVEKSIEVRKNIGYLPEHNPLYLDMYVKEYLEFTAGLYKLGKNTKKRITEMIGMTGLELEQHKKLSALSKGYRQRVGLAQALIHDPKVLILDEPTTGLDPNQIVEIRNLILEVGKKKTVMLSTHIMQEVEAICDKIIIIKQGSIVANDDTKKISTYTSDNSQNIFVEFDISKIENINNEKLKTLLENISDVTKVVKIENNEWLIQSNKDKDIRPQIFNFAVKNGLILLSMQKQEKNLEEIFRELTL